MGHFKAKNGTHHDHSQAPEVAAFVVAIADTDSSLDLAEDLRCCVGQREAGRVEAALGPLRPEAGEAEVDDLQFGVVARFGEENVLEKKSDQFYLLKNKIIYNKIIPD